MDPPPARKSVKETIQSTFLKFTHKEGYGACLAFVYALFEFPWIIGILALGALGLYLDDTVFHIHGDIPPVPALTVFCGFIILFPIILIFNILSIPLSIIFIMIAFPSIFIRNMVRKICY